MVFNHRIFNSLLKAYSKIHDKIHDEDVIVYGISNILKKGWMQ
jgi:hypothetical protein